MPKKSTLIIDGDNKGAVRAIDQTTQKLGRAVGQVQSMGSGLSGALSGFGGILTNLPFMASAAAVGIVASMGAMVKSSVENSEALEKMSQKVGVSVEFLSTLTYSAELAGTEISTMEKGIMRLSRNLYDANAGLGDAVRSFSELNIATKDGNGNLKSSEELVYELADRFSKMEDGSLKTAYAMKLFGRAGAELIPLLNQGSEGLKKQREEARKLGLEISTNTAKQAATFTDNLTIVKYSMQGVANTLAEALLPQLVGLSQGLVNLSGNSQALVPALSALATIIKVLVTFFGGLAAGIYVAGQSLGIFYATAAKVLTLQWGDIDDVWAAGFKNIKEFSLSMGSIFDALWNQAGDTQDLMASIKNQMKMEQENAQVEQHQKAWESLSKTLENDIAKTSLPAISFALFQVGERFDEYRNKFPEHLPLIQQWRDAQINAILDVSKNLQEVGSKAAQQPLLPQQFDMLPLSQEDVDYYKSLNDQMIQQSSQVTSAELANLALREGVLSDTLGNMSDAFANFAQISNNQNKAMFAVSKAFAIAEAGVATYLAANKALAEVPFPFNFVAAASVIAAGIGNIARIASMQPGNTASGGGVAAAPQMPSERQLSTTNDNRQTTYQINFYGDYSGDKDRLARDLIDAINKANDDGLTINRR